MFFHHKVLTWPSCMRISIIAVSGVAKKDPGVNQFATCGFATQCRPNVYPYFNLTTAGPWTPLFSFVLSSISPRHRNPQILSNTLQNSPLPAICDGFFLSGRGSAFLSPLFLFVCFGCLSHQDSTKATSVCRFGEQDSWGMCPGMHEQVPKR